jgi:hypothetical protein
LRAGTVVVTIRPATACVLQLLTLPIERQVQLGGDT